MELGRLLVPSLAACLLVGTAPSVMGAGEGVQDASHQQMRYELSYQREGQAVRPAGRENKERFSYSLNVSISQDALMAPLTGENESPWQAWEYANAGSLATGRVDFTASITRDRYDSEFPQRIQVKLYADLQDAELATLHGLLPGGVRFPDPHPHLTFSIPLQGEFTGLAAGQRPDGVLMQLAAVAASPITPKDTDADYVASIEADWKFYPVEVPRPQDSLLGMLYDLEGSAVSMFDVTHPALAGGFTGGQLSGQPHADWRFELISTREWQEGEDHVNDSVSLKVVPVGQTLE